MKDLSPAEQRFTHDPPRLRAIQAEMLCQLLADMDQTDAAQVMTAALDEMRIGGPQGATFGPVRDDAEWWAETAPQHELQEYAYAAMKVMAGRALGRSARLRFLAVLWNGVSPDDKREFLARVALT